MQINHILLSNTGAISSPGPLGEPIEPAQVSSIALAFDKELF